MICVVEAKATNSLHIFAAKGSQEHLDSEYLFRDLCTRIKCTSDDLTSLNEFPAVIC